jgi:hypothetical protein
MSETDARKRIQLALCEDYPGRRLFRNNVGFAWQSNETRKMPGGALLLLKPRPIHFGLHEGSHDIIGIQPVVITPEMVGRTIGQFVSVEVKVGRGKQTQQQQRWGEMVALCGGLVIEGRG